jgi:hypothetical protein
MNINHDTGTIDTISILDTTVAPPLGAASNSLNIVGTGGVFTPVGSTAQRPSPTNGGIRYNSDTNLMEFAETYPEGARWSTHVQMNTIMDANILTGFVDTTSSALSFTNITRTVSISPTAGTFELYYNGLRIVVSTTQTVVIPNVEGIYYIYFDSTGTLRQQTARWEVGQIRVAWVYWAAAQSIGYPFGDTRQAMSISYDVYDFLNSAVGLIAETGLTATGYTITGTGSINSDAQLSITDGILMDGGVEVSITNAPTPSAPFQQILNGPAQLPIYHFSGAGYFKEAANAFPLKQGTSTAQYNYFNGSTWTTVDATDGYYIVTYVLASFGQVEPVFGVLGDQQFSTLTAAQFYSSWANYVARNNVSSLSPVIRPLYVLIYQTSSTFANTPHARLAEVIDMSIIPPNGKQLDHSTLSGNNRDDHPLYVTSATPRTITAQHTFAPLIAEPPFILGSNAQTQLIVGLNADQLDGFESTYFQPSTVNLTSLSSMATTGLYVVTGSGTSSTRAITSTGTTLTITNGSGVAGNINIDLPNIGTPVSASFDKITTDAQGRITATTAVLSSDITTVLGYAPVNKSGDTLLGILNLGGFKITNLGSPATGSDAATKQYVDSIATGLIWIPPVSSMDLVGNVTMPPVSVISGDVYIIDAGGNTGVWSGFAVGDIVQYQTSAWVLLTASAIGNRFGINSGTTVPVGAFIGYANAIAQITGGAAGSWTYSITAPANSNSLYISNPIAIHYGTAYTYSTSLSQWVPFSQSITITNGGGLYFIGSSLNVGTASTSRIVVNATNIDLAITGVTAGTYTKMTVDVYGRATVGSSLGSTDVTAALGYIPQTQNVNLAALSGTATTGIYVVTGSGVSATRSIVVPAGMSIASADGVAGNPTISLAGELAAVQGLATMGMTVRSGTGVWATRSIVVPAGMSIASADGVAGNPTISLAGELAAVEGLATTGIVARVGTGVWAARSIVGQANQISMSNGDLLAGNGTISLASDPIIPGTSSLTLPSGTLAQQPALGSSVSGMVRYDSTLAKMELFDGAWKNIATESFTSTGYVPYTGATSDLNLGAHTITASVVDTLGIVAANVVITTTYASAASDHTILADATVAGFTISLMASPTNGAIINIKKIDSTPNIITVSGNGFNIDGAPSLQIAYQWNSVTLHYNSSLTAWFII